jgi:lipopolysaccharide export system protein LptA
MRNSEARRYARWAAAVALLVTASVAWVYLRRDWMAKQAEKKAPPPVPSTVAQRSADFSYSKVEGQRTIYTIRALRATEFKEGSRNLLEDVSISVFGRSGERHDTLLTKACDYISSTGRVTCAGEVQISLQGTGADAEAKAIQVATSNLSFERDSGKAETENPVTFHWPDGEGRSNGVEYDSNNGTLTLKSGVELSLMAAAPGASRRNALGKAVPASLSAPAPASPTRLTGNRMEFRREARMVQLLGDVHARHDSQELTAGALLVELDSALVARRLVASGNPELHDADARGNLALAANLISAALTQDGLIDSIVTSGNVHGTRNTTAGSDEMQAGRVEIKLASQQEVPRLVTARGGVTVTSRGAIAASGTRRLETDALELHFANAARTGETLLASVNTLAPARIDWQSTASVGGKPVPQAMRMSGRQMSLKFGAQNQLQRLQSSGGVEVTRKLGDEPPQTTASKDLTAVFTDGGEWSTVDQTGNVRFRDGVRAGQSDRAHLDRAGNAATLTGSVILSDAGTRTTAQTATFAQNANQLRADGKVLTTELHAGTGSLTNFASDLAHISAEHLWADTARGHATYSGNARLWQGQTVVEADAVDLDSSAHQMIARGHVRGIFPQAAETTTVGSGSNSAHKQSADHSARPGNELGHVGGGLLTYWDSESRARLEQDADAQTPRGSIHANRIDLFFSSPGAASASNPSTSKQLTRAVAAGNVTVRQQDRKGTSDLAEYTSAEGKFVLSHGKPTVYDSNGDTTTGRQLTFFFADDRIVVDSEEGSKTVTLHRVEK